jgi:hypothetical protein
MTQKISLGPLPLEAAWYESLKKIQYQYQASMKFFKKIQYQVGRNSFKADLIPPP